MLNERPIIFNSEMVCAILDGRKTQTRRVIKRDIARCIESGLPIEKQRIETDCGPLAGVPVLRFCPYGVPGDRLWVRETWQLWNDEGRLNTGVKYKADGDIMKPTIWDDNQGNWCECASEDNRWRSSIYMPRWASRIALEVVGVKVERVQEITKHDAIAEGCRVGVGAGNYCDERHYFQLLWDSINDKHDHGWDTNPWMWCVEFEKLDEKESP